MKLETVYSSTFRGNPLHFSAIKQGFMSAFDEIKDMSFREVRKTISKDKKPILSKPDSNTKLAKRTDRTAGYELYSLFLAPAGSSGYNTCPWASDECVKLCLNSAGRGAMESVQQARISKTKFLAESPRLFMLNMISELISAMRSATANGNKLALRINGTSDIPWESVAPFIEVFCVNGNYEHGVKAIENLTKFNLYDYTKSFARINRSPVWYDMTLSYSGQNWQDCKSVLDNKIGRVAMVFDGEPPSEYKGYTVVRGDDDDYRFMDLKGVIVGLSYKSTGKKNDDWVKGDQEIGFVVRL